MQRCKIIKIMNKDNINTTEDEDLSITNSNNNINTFDIESLIYCIRGVQVMLDKDLAMLYGVETRIINQAVKRNTRRFPSDFMFQLTKEECSKSQFVILNGKRGQNLKFLPYAFTESGIAMLSSVLKSQTAIEVNIRIMRTFIAMRRFLVNNTQIIQRLSTIEYHQVETDKRIDEVFNRLDANAQPQQGIFFDGQIFDAYQFVCGLIRNAQRTIVLIDNYVDETVLSILDKRNENVSATIYTANLNQQLQIDLQRHNSQYPMIEIIRFHKAHDRFLIIDNEVYLIGASIKDLGKKWFGFTLIKEITAEEIINKIRL